MAIRYIKVFAPRKDMDKIKEAIKEHSLSFLVVKDVDDKTIIFEFLSETDKAEPILDWLEDTVGYRKGFQVILLPVEATIPPLEENKEPKAKIASRTVINISDVTLALASGVAGVLAITTGTSTNLVGVMVAIALFPPLGIRPRTWWEEEKAKKAVRNSLIIWGLLLLILITLIIYFYR